jgi:hypothetical protein
MVEVKRKKSPWRIFAGAAISISVAAIVGQSVLASLNATAFNTIAKDVDSGTLKISLTDSGAGFTQDVTNLAPGDVVNRFVTLTNTGTLDGKDLTLKTATTGAAELVTDGVSPSTTKALRLTVISCPNPWTVTTGTCTGSEVIELSERVLSATTAPINLASTSLNSLGVKYLKVSLALPNQDETTINGNPPPSSIQGKAAAITYTFGVAQRTAQNTNS